MELKKQIDEVFNKYIRNVWVNPYLTKTDIPAENILPLKQEILKLIERKKEL